MNPPRAEAGFMIVRRLILWAIVLLAAAAGRARADIFWLEDGGQVRGELVNRDESPRKTYVVKTSSGGQVVLDAKSVKEVKRQWPLEVKYDQIRASYPDTVEGQWKLAEWCRENRLTAQRKVHLERILELDPDHAQARHGLGYTQVHGRWARPETLMTEKGYVKYEGKWVLPQEVEILEQQRKERLAQSDWNRKLKRWRAWLGTDKAEEATASFKSIDDPFAARPLAKLLNHEQNREVRMMYIEIIGRLNAAPGMDALVDTSLDDDDEEVRLACLDQVVLHQYKPATNRYVKALKTQGQRDHQPGRVVPGARQRPRGGQPADRRAGHQPPDSTSRRGSRAAWGRPLAMGQGGSFGGLSVGSSVEVINQRIENRNVLAALVDLTAASASTTTSAPGSSGTPRKRNRKALNTRRDDGKK